jgi:valyl-tRNA synthetase
LEIEARFARFQEVLSGLREVRSRQNIPPTAPLKFSVRANAEIAALLRPMEPYFRSMAGAEATAWGPEVTAPATSACDVIAGAEIVVDLAEHVDVEAETVRKTKELERLAGAIAGKERQLSNANFVDRAPAEVIEKERAALAQLHEQKAAAERALAALKRAGK